jgi:ParB family chromosome partitioning protein
MQQTELVPQAPETQAQPAPEAADAAEAAARRQPRHLPIRAIRPNPFQPRAHIDPAELDGLAASIRALGLLQPITVRSTGPNGWELIAGERRLRACEHLGMTHIDAIVIPAGDVDCALLALAENAQHAPLHFLEEAHAYDALQQELGQDLQGITERLGVDPALVLNKLRLLRLPSAIRELIWELDLSERHARALMRLPDDARQRIAAQRMADRQLTPREAEALVDAMLREMPNQRRHILSVIRDHRPYLNAIRDIVEQMQKSGMAAALDMLEDGDQMEIHIRMPRKAAAG